MVSFKIHNTVDNTFSRLSIETDSLYRDLVAHIQDNFHVVLKGKDEEKVDHEQVEECQLTFIDDEGDACIITTPQSLGEIISLCGNKVVHLQVVPIKSVGSNADKSSDIKFPWKCTPEGRREVGEKWCTKIEGFVKSMKFKMDKKEEPSKKKEDSTHPFTTLLAKAVPFIIFNLITHLGFIAIIYTPSSYGTLTWGAWWTLKAPIFKFILFIKLVLRGHKKKVDKAVKQFFNTPSNHIHPKPE